MSRSERISEYQLTVDLLAVATERRRRHVDDFCVREMLDDVLPACGGAVVSFVDDDHVEEVVGELRKPLIDVGCELLYVRDDDMRLVATDMLPLSSVHANGPQIIASSSGRRFPPEALLLVRDVQRLEELVLDREVRRDD